MALGEQSPQFHRLQKGKASVMIEQNINWQIVLQRLLLRKEWRRAVPLRREGQPHPEATLHHQHGQVDHSAQRAAIQPGQWSLRQGQAQRYFQQFHFGFKFRV